MNVVLISALWLLPPKVDEPEQQNPESDQTSDAHNDKDGISWNRNLVGKWSSSLYSSLYHVRLKDYQTLPSNFAPSTRRLKIHHIVSLIHNVHKCVMISYISRSSYSYHSYRLLDNNIMRQKCRAKLVLTISRTILVRPDPLVILAFQPPFCIGAWRITANCDVIMDPFYPSVNGWSWIRTTNRCIENQVIE